MFGFFSNLFGQGRDPNKENSIAKENEKNFKEAQKKFDHFFDEKDIVEIDKK